MCLVAFQLLASLPHIFMVWCLIKLRGSFTFTSNFFPFPFSFSYLSSFVCPLYSSTVLFSITLNFVIFLVICLFCLLYVAQWFNSVLSPLVIFQIWIVALSLNCWQFLRTLCSVSELWPLWQRSAWSQFARGKSKRCSIRTNVNTTSYVTDNSLVAISRTWKQCLF